MPPYKPVKNLSQLSTDTVAKLIYNALEPYALKRNILNFYKSNNVSTSDYNKIDSINYDRKNRKTARSYIPEPKSIKKTDLCAVHLLPLSATKSLRQRPSISVDATTDCMAPLNIETDLDILVEGTDFDSFADSQQYLMQHDIVYEYVDKLIYELTSVSHCSLHNQLFWTIMPKLNYLYTKNSNKKLRKLLRIIVPYFINSRLKEFSFGSFKMFTEASMFQAIFSQLKEATGLEKLMFGRSCYWRSKSMEDLSYTLQNMGNLQILHIHYICRPIMLQDLSKRCPLLRELSLKGSKDITNVEIPLLINFKNLETIDISGTAVTGKGCRILIKSLPLLVWLTHCPFNCNSDTLIFESRADLFNYMKYHLKLQDPFRAVSPPTEEGYEVENSEKGGRFTLNLKSFWLFNTTTEELMVTLVCPQLEHLRLDFVIQDLEIEPEIDVIRKLQCLSSLDLYIYDRCPIDLVTSIVECGRSLSHLHLHLGDEWFFVAPIMNAVAQSCPTLSHLTMEGDYKGVHSLEESDSRLDFTLAAEGLSRLKEARLAGCVSDLRLLHLLVQAPNLEVLHLDGELEWLHDETFSRARQSRLLLQLRELWFNVSTGVTLECVRQLLSENNLQKIGRLCLMASATKEVYQELLSYAKMRNLCIELIWVTDQREMLVKTAPSIDF